jgi:hypothetical protein
MIVVFVSEGAFSSRRWYCAWLRNIATKVGLRFGRWKAAEAQRLL